MHTCKKKDLTLGSPTQGSPNSIRYTLIHLTKNQVETKRQEIANLSQYTTKVIRESYNLEVEKLVAIKGILDSVLKLHDDKPKTIRK